MASVLSGPFCRFGKGCGRLWPQSPRPVVYAFEVNRKYIIKSIILPIFYAYDTRKILVYTGILHHCSKITESLNAHFGIYVGQKGSRIVMLFCMEIEVTNIAITRKLW